MTRERAEPFSAVVVAWNSAHELRALLKTVDEHLEGECELVVVDNASEDESVAAVREWAGAAVVVPLGSNVGFGAACNIGVRRARHERIVLLNPDTLLVDGSLARLAALADETRALCGPELLNADGTRQPSASAPPAGWEVGLQAVLPAAAMPEALRIRCEPWRARRRARVGWLTGACVAARRELLLRLGPFDDRLVLYGEDLDLGLRARSLGIPSLFAPDVARVVHLGGRSTSRRFGERALAVSARARREVVRSRLGAARETYDHLAQVVFHVTRFAAKSLLGRAAVRERRWLEATFSPADRMVRRRHAQPIGRNAGNVRAG